MFLLSGLVHRDKMHDHMKRSKKETLQKAENNAQKIRNHLPSILQRLELNPHLHDQVISAQSEEIELVDRVGQIHRVRIIVMCNLHCSNKQDYIFVGLVPSKRVDSCISKLKKGASLQKQLAHAYKEFFIVRDRRKPSQVTSKSKIHVKESVLQGVGIGTGLFLLAEEVRNAIIKTLAPALRISQMTVEIFDENGGADWTARLVAQHFPFFVEQREHGLFKYTYRL